MPRSRVASRSALVATAVAAIAWLATAAPRVEASVETAPVGATSPEAPATTGSGPSVPSRQVQVPAAPGRPPYWAFVPTGPVVPRTILLALHGMGQSGEAIGGQLMPFAQERGWVIVAPTLEYGEWRDPDRLAGAEARLIPSVFDAVDHARRELGVPTRDRIVVFGFSRGAHAAARIGLLIPQKVVAVAAAAGSAYTLPTATARDATGAAFSAPFPFGTADVGRYFGRVIDADAIARVQYWVGVGANDNRDGDVPRVWDAFLGRNRMARAVRFAHAMDEAGCVTRIAVVPDMGHELSPPAMADGTAFLAAALATDGLRDASTAQVPGSRAARAPSVARPPAAAAPDPPPDSVVSPTAMTPLRPSSLVVAIARFAPTSVLTRLVARRDVQ